MLGKGGEERRVANLKKISYQSYALAYPRAVMIKTLDAIIAN